MSVFENSLKKTQVDIWKAIEFLSRKVLRVYYVRLVSDSGFITFRVAQRGNVAYQQGYLRGRVGLIKRVLKRLIRVVGDPKGIGSSNALLITLTFDGSYSLEQTWEIVKSLSGKIRGLIRRLGAIAYVKVVEAHLSGKAHLHLLVVLQGLVKYRYDVVKKRGFILDKKVYDWLKCEIDKFWGYGFYDVRPLIGSSEAVDYVSKYIFKAGEIETILEGIRDGKIEVEKMSESVIKKLLLHYLASKFKVRFFTVSEGIQRLDKGFKNNLSSKGVWSRCDVGYWEIRYGGIIEKFDKFLSIRGSPNSLVFKGVVDLGKIEGFKFNDEGRFEALSNYFGFSDPFYSLPEIWGYRFNALSGNRGILEIEFYHFGVSDADWVCYFVNS